MPTDELVSVVASPVAQVGLMAVRSLLAFPEQPVRRRRASSRGCHARAEARSRLLGDGVVEDVQERAGRGELRLGPRVRLLRKPLPRHHDHCAAVVARDIETAATDALAPGNKSSMVLMVTYRQLMPAGAKGVDTEVIWHHAESDWLRGSASCRDRFRSIPGSHQYTGSSGFSAITGETERRTMR